MGKIHTMMDEIVSECERQNIPFLGAFGLDKIAIYEYAPDNTPERIRKARITLVTTTAQARRQLEIQA
jgi:hypothetical protein